MVAVLKHLPIAALLGVALIGGIRALTLYRRGVAVVVVDRQRTRGDFALELALVALFPIWIYLAIDYTTGGGPPWLPGWADKMLAEPWPAGMRWLGAVLLACGVTLYALATKAMGDSWRLGIDRKAHEQPTGDHPATLVTQGVFAWSRNPIYLGFDFILIGVFAIHGRIVFLLLAVFMELLLHLQILREERLLAAWYGERFDEYRRRVGRYGPWG